VSTTPAETAHHHNPGFLALVNAARERVRTLSIDEFVVRLQGGERFVLLDNREDLEWQRGHLPGAHHMGKGVIEREIEAAAIQDMPDVLGEYEGLRAMSLQLQRHIDRLGIQPTVMQRGTEAKADEQAVHELVDKFAQRKLGLHRIFSGYLHEGEA